MQRFDLALKSPIFQHFGESVDGASSVRAYRAEERFREISRSFLDAELAAYYMVISGNRWLAIRLESLGTAIVVSSSVLAVMGRDTLVPGLAGLALSTAFQVTQSLNWTVRMASEWESNIVSVERISEYITDCPQEAPTYVESYTPPAEWPEHGSIKIKDIQLRYRPNLPLVLKGLTVEFGAGEKVGIVGRTGAGKSSTMVALLRLTELCGGEIEIDGWNTSKMGLWHLRNQISIIPQEPIIFSGSLRYNLDPLSLRNDFEIWNALEKSHLKTFVESLPKGLDHEISEAEENLSLGQCQLVCLARALLRSSKILLLDEATSAIDPYTDSLVQETIRKEFHNCTILTIAHRVDTIVDYDRILVMDDGRLAEFGRPEELMAKENGIFRSMCVESNISLTNGVTG
eukprot:CAMPEP_0113845072 /NCGR_PEP_ID=MMETSP0372-20130328/563_1 /TAXON_ID=340204 /ORGANISM="Lankesteria abbotti" /LENGTH=401 /DNA_ID=CAMNT_0000814093 /DNA_START=366 /DNA_END=1571 /DNA_ORIENTATION=- /assembly_acc=CAM_ASM_000359